MQEEPDFLHKVVDAGLPPAAPHVQHPLVGGLIVLFPLIRRDVPGRETQGQTDRQTDRRRGLTNKGEMSSGDVEDDLP